MQTNLTYSEAIVLIAKGVWAIMKMLPRTFAKQTRKIITNHPIYLVFFISIIIWQSCKIGNERIVRDQDSKAMYQMQKMIDSLQGKPVVYAPVKKKDLE